MAALVASSYGVTVAFEGSETRGTSPRVPTVSVDDRARASTFSALGSRDFRVFWYACLVWSTSTLIQHFALGWFVVELAVREGVPARASLYLGLVGLSYSVPALVLG